MSVRPPLVLATGLVAASAAAGLWGYLVLPPGATVAIQMGLDGRMHDHLPKAYGLSLLPGVAALVIAGLAFSLLRPRHRQALEAAGQPIGAVMVGVAGLLLACQLSLVQGARDPDFQLVNIVAIATGVFLAMLGDSLGKARQNPFLGVRTRATLADPRVWDKANRLTARLMFATGCALVVAGFTLHDVRLLAAAIALAAAAPPLIGALRSTLGRRETRT